MAFVLRVRAVSAAFDILGLGAVAVDELIYVDAYPAADQKADVLHTERQCGGLTATALVAAARFGAKCAFAGVLGTDELSMFARQSMEREGISLDHLLERPEARPVHSYILVDQERSTRNIFADARGVAGADPGWPSADLIRSSRVLFIDHVGLPGMIRATKIAREAAIPRVADLERESGPGFHELLDLTDHLIISLRFAQTLTGRTEAAEVVEHLWTTERDTVVVTAGENGCWFKTRSTGSGVQHQIAFPVGTVDTTGCGDVFHGVYAAALAENLPVQRRILLASAAAALKATQPGGQAGIPTRTALEKFITRS